MKNEQDYKMSNREKTQIAKKGKFWCRRCDAQIVGEWGKCPNCGYKDKRFKNKSK
mgnify:CR=1 FL=1